MDGKSSAELSLPWFWIIEYLAKFEQVKPSLLHVIIKAAPEMPAHLRENMEEVVSLRCLEELCGIRNGSMNSTWSSMESKAKINTSNSCKNVLQYIIQNGSASDLGVTALELSKWDLHSFLMHKRASVPKTALEELQDTILEGTHRHADSLKELSRLAPVSHLNRSVIHNGEHTGRTCVPDVGDACARNTVDEPSLVSRPTNHMELLEGDDDIMIGLPRKRNHTDVHAENIERNCNENQHHDAHSDAKRAKQQDSDKIKDREESPVVLTRRFGFERIDGCSEREMAILVEDHMGAVDEDRLSVGDGRHHVQLRTCDVLSHGMEQGFSVDDSTRIHDSIEKTKNSESARASQWGQTFTSNVEDYVVHTDGEETSSDSDEYRKEEKDVMMKKHEFLYSQSQRPSPRSAFAAVDWSEQNVCVKCNEGGQLLACNTSSCPLMAHENCVGLSAMFDDNGMFYCPFCAYSMAISDYHAAKKEASSTRENLSAFIRAGFEHQQENLDHMEQSMLGNGTSETDRVNGHNEMDVNGHQFQWNEGDGEQDDPSQRFNGSDADLPSREEEEMVRGGDSTDAVEFSEGKWKRENNSKMVERTPAIEKRMEEKMVQAQPSGQVLEREQDQELENNLFINGAVAYKNTFIVPVNQRDEVGNGQDVLHKDATDTPDGVACANITAEETSEDEDNETSISKYRISFRGQKNQEEASANPLVMQNEAPLMVVEEQTPEPTSQPEPNAESLPSGQLRPSSPPLPSKHISRFSTRGRRCLKTYASSVVPRRSARIRSFARPSKERTEDDAGLVIEID
ncbi:PHD-type domain-containing protein [Psidium guajava]|nr:PHD-type domain-containing protein [Psidium guajava]